MARIPRARTSLRIMGSLLAMSVTSIDGRGVAFVPAYSAHSEDTTRETSARNDHQVSHFRDGNCSGGSVVSGPGKIASACVVAKKTLICPTGATPGGAVAEAHAVYTNPAAHALPL